MFICRSKLWFNYCFTSKRIVENSNSWTSFAENNYLNSIILTLTGKKEIACNGTAIETSVRKTIKINYVK